MERARVREAVELLWRHPDLDEEGWWATLGRAGYTEVEARLITAIVPEAFAFPLLDRLGVRMMPCLLVPTRARDFLRVDWRAWPAFAEALEAARLRLLGGPGDAYQKIALRSAGLVAANKALAAGDSLKGARSVCSLLGPVAEEIGPLPLWTAPSEPAGEGRSQQEQHGAASAGTDAAPTVRLETVADPAMTGPVAAQACCDALNALRPGWTVSERGITGPGGALVRLDQAHASGAFGHVDLQFVLDERATPQVAVWDCVAGYGDSLQERAAMAARLWAGSTAGALLELEFAGSGELATHDQAGEASGLPGFHVIHGRVVAFGEDDRSERLRQWWHEHPVLPALAPALAESLHGEGPHGLKILFGGADIAEVRLDGARHDAASERLASLPWPRLGPVPVVRSFVVVVRREAS